MDLWVNMIRKDGLFLYPPYGVCTSSEAGIYILAAGDIHPRIGGRRMKGTSNRIIGVCRQKIK